MSSRRHRIVGPPWIDLCVAILRRVPRLDGALCVDNAELFDGDGPYGERTAVAVGVCHRCVAMPECRRWVAALPKAHRPPGVVAGEWMTPKTTVGER